MPFALKGHNHLNLRIVTALSTTADMDIWSQTHNKMQTEPRNGDSLALFIIIPDKPHKAVHNDNTIIYSRDETSHKLGTPKENEEPTGYMIV